MLLYLLYFVSKKQAIIQSKKYTDMFLTKRDQLGVHGRERKDIEVCLFVARLVCFDRSKNVSQNTKTNLNCIETCTHLITCDAV